MTSAETIAALCTRHPLALSVLQDLAIATDDPSASVETCCAARGVAPEALRSAVASVEDEAAVRWNDLTIDALLDAVLRTFHRPFAHELEALTHRLETARASTHRESWSAVIAELVELRIDLEHHIEMEERVVFPWLRTRAASAVATIRALMLEHADTIAHLLSIDTHARQCLAADPADPSGRAAVASLQRFERWFCEHIHVESNTLFPRALQAELARR